MSKLDLTAVGAEGGDFCYVQDKAKSEIRLRRAIVGTRTIKRKGHEDEYETEMRWHLTKFKDREARAVANHPVVIYLGELQDQNDYSTYGYWVCRKAGDSFFPLHSAPFDAYNYAKKFLNTDFPPHCEHCGCDKKLVERDAQRFNIGPDFMCCDLEEYSIPGLELVQVN